MTPAVAAVRQLRVLGSGDLDRHVRLVKAADVLCALLKDAAARAGTPHEYDDVLREFWVGSWWYGVDRQC